MQNACSNSKTATVLLEELKERDPGFHVKSTASKMPGKVIFKLRKNEATNATTPPYSKRNLLDIVNPFEASPGRADKPLSAFIVEEQKKHKAATFGSASCNNATVVSGASAFTTPTKKSKLDHATASQEESKHQDGVADTTMFPQPNSLEVMASPSPLTPIKSDSHMRNQVNDYTPYKAFIDNPCFKPGGARTTRTWPKGLSRIPLPPSTALQSDKEAKKLDLESDEVRGVLSNAYHRNPYFKAGMGRRVPVMAVKPKRDVSW